MSRKVKLLLIVFLSLPELFGLGAWAVGSYQDRAHERITKQNLHAIQLALERYEREDLARDYPVGLEALRTKALLTTFPRNPYSKQPMRQLQPADPPSAGDFCYLTLRPSEPNTTSTTRHGVDGFLLVAYGAHRRRPNAYFPDPGDDLFPGASRISWHRVLIYLER